MFCAEAGIAMPRAAGVPCPHTVGPSREHRLRGKAFVGKPTDAGWNSVGLEV